MVGLLSIISSSKTSLCAADFLQSVSKQLIIVAMPMNLDHLPGWPVEHRPWRHDTCGGGDTQRRVPFSPAPAAAQPRQEEVPHLRGAVHQVTNQSTGRTTLTSDWLGAASPVSTRGRSPGRGGGPASTSASCSPRPPSTACCRGSASAGRCRP